MIRKDSYVPLAQLGKPLTEARLAVISSCGVHARNDRPLDVCHPSGEFRFRRVPSQLRDENLIIHQLKYPHDDDDVVVDINVIFPIERLQELAAEGVLGGLSDNFFSFIGYSMDPEKFERTVAATSLRPSCQRKEPMWRCWRPLDPSAISP